MMCPPSRNLRHATFIGQNILDSLTGYSNSIDHLIYSQSLVNHHIVVETVNVFLDGSYRIYRHWIIFKSLLCPPYSAANPFTVDNKVGTSTPTVTIVSTWIYLEAELFFCKYLLTTRCQVTSIYKEKSLLVTFKVSFELWDVSSTGKKECSY